MALAVILVVALFVFGIGRLTGGSKNAKETSTQAPTVLERDVLVQGVNIKGLTQDEAVAAVRESISWSMRVRLADSSSGSVKLQAGTTNESTGAAQDGDGSSDLTDEELEQMNLNLGDASVSGDAIVLAVDLGDVVKVNADSNLNQTGHKVASNVGDTSIKTASTNSNMATLKTVAIKTATNETSSTDEAIASSEDIVSVDTSSDVEELDDLILDRISEIIGDIYEGQLSGTSYKISSDDVSEKIDAVVLELQERWDVTARNGAISTFNTETNKFEYIEGTKGRRIDTDSLTTQIKQAIDASDFDATIVANYVEVQPVITKEEAEARYKTIGTFQTTTTSNSDRNNNIRIACEAIDGIILQAGEEFSFNEATGNRTEAKGYKMATAYVNGEVSMEPGGGVCQVSSTLYNAVIYSGMTTTERHAHTFKPSYVPAGEDAMVSYDGYDGPDMKFINSTQSAIAIRASFADQVLTISLIGIPILEEGVSISMESKQTAEYDNASITYEEDPTLEPGQEVIVSEGTMGSLWITDIITKKDGVEISRKQLHTSTYKGSTKTIRRNAIGQTDEYGNYIVTTTDEYGNVITMTVDPTVISSTDEESTEGTTAERETTKASTESTRETTTSGTRGPGSNMGSESTRATSGTSSTGPTAGTSSSTIPSPTSSGENIGPGSTTSSGTQETTSATDSGEDATVPPPPGV